ncbi:biotin/lipoyl-containing protein, partial [Corallococcus sp. AB038B]|uniref:acetyl-CoA carboxylase biotin carboxyl carrier protein subunit n=2 Tax=Myxococcaceae TaxID=31 RepID=UPI000EB98B0F
YEVSAGGESLEVGVLGLADSVFDYSVGGARGRARYLRSGDSLWLDLGVGARRLTDVTFRPAKSSEGAGTGRLLAPMDGRILRVDAKPGDVVKPGDVLLVLEAMKMEFQLAADIPGVVEAVNASAGGQVSAK